MLLKNGLRLLFALALCLAATAKAIELLPISPPLTPLMIGITPSYDTTALQQQYAPLLDYLRKKLQHPVELFIPENYEMLSNAIEAGKIHIIYLDPLLYVRNAAKGNIDIFAREIRINHLKNQDCVIISHKQTLLQKSNDLRQKKWLYVDTQSACGFLIPRLYFALIMQINPTEYFANVDYAGSHEKAILALKNNQIDAIATSSRYLNAPHSMQSWKSQDFYIIWRSKPIPSDALAFHKDLSKETKEILKKIFLDIKDDEVLKSLHINGYIHAEHQEYELIHRMFLYQQRIESKIKK